MNILGEKVEFEDNMDMEMIFWIVCILVDCVQLPLDFVDYFYNRARTPLNLEFGFW